MISIGFCGLMAAICALLLFHVGLRVRSSPSTFALDTALSTAAFSATSVAMSAAWIIAAGTAVRVDVQISAVMVGFLCASVSASICAVLRKVHSVTIHTFGNRRITVCSQDTFKGFQVEHHEICAPELK